MEKIRRSILAGSWYPGNPSVLRGDILRYVKSVPDKDIQGDIKGLIVPHAGYVYSGQVAAYAYKLIQGKKYDSVILIGPSHRVAFRGVSIYGRGAFETPLGQISVDENLVAQMTHVSRIISDIPAAHAQEHSLEIQLPFLQVVLGNFSIVPLVMGDQTADVCREIADSIVKLAVNRRILVVASSDLSHFHDDKKARQLDGIILRCIEDYDIEGLLENLNGDKAEACGGGPIAVTMMASKKMGARRSHLLNYANSGDVTGDKRSVVGYAAAVCY